MLKRLLPPVCAALLLITLCSGCKKDSNGNLVIKLNATYNGQYFALDTFNTDPSGRVFSFVDCMFYLSNITLVKTNNETVNVSAVNLFDLGNPALQSVTLNNIATGDFKAITYGCGVDSVQNNTNPSDVALSSPLNANYDYPATMYWPMLKYRFEVLDGVWDTAILPIMRNAVSYHVGGNAYYTNGQANQSFSVCCGQTTTLTLNLDLYKIFNGSKDTLNVVTEPGTQSSSADPPIIATTFANNFSHAFTLLNP